MTASAPAAGKSGTLSPALAALLRMAPSFCRVLRRHMPPLLTFTLRATKRFRVSRKRGLSQCSLDGVLAVLTYTVAPKRRSPTPRLSIDGVNERPERPRWTPRLTIYAVAVFVFGVCLENDGADVLLGRSVRDRTK
jgi:hypothetical protein